METATYSPEWSLVFVCILFIILPSVFVALRLWSRRLQRIALSASDYWIIVALVFTWSVNIISVIGYLIGGQGKHYEDATGSEIEVGGKVIVAMTFLWPTANSCVKISVLYFYRVLFHDRPTRIGIYLIGALTVAYWAACIFTAFGICRPFGFLWNSTSINQNCGDMLAYYLVTAIMNLVGDFLVVFLPLPVLWRLQMKTSKKISLTLIFSVGISICIITIIRCYVVSMWNQGDTTYYVVLSNILSMLEPTLGTINACLPLLKPVLVEFSRFRRRLLSSRSPSSSDYDPKELNWAVNWDDLPRPRPAVVVIQHPELDSVSDPGSATTPFDPTDSQVSAPPTLRGNETRRYALETRWPLRSHGSERTLHELP